MLKVTTLNLIRRLAGAGLSVGLADYAFAGAGAAEPLAAPPEAAVTTICLSNACTSRQGVGAVESPRLDRAALEQAYAALAVRGITVTLYETRLS